MTEVLRAIYDGHEAAPQIFAAFERLSLFRPINLEIDFGGERRFRFSDYHAIDRERLGALGGAELEQLNRDGYLRLAVLADASLGNIPRLIERKSRAG